MLIGLATLIFLIYFYVYGCSVYMYIYVLQLCLGPGGQKVSDPCGTGRKDICEPLDSSLRCLEEQSVLKLLSHLSRHTINFKVINRIYLCAN